jgi:hypothetical protein
MTRGRGAGGRRRPGRASAAVHVLVATLAFGAAALPPGVVHGAAAAAGDPVPAPTAGTATTAGLPPSALAVRHAGAWHTWWSAAEAPARWTSALPVMARAARWQPAQPGIEWARLRLAGRGEAWRLGVVVVRLDPRLVRLELAPAGGPRTGWSIDAMPDDAVLALNAGHFADGVPWGWLVREGAEVQPPGTGSLASAVIVDATGAVRIVDADSIAAVRAGGGIRAAFQSYPALLTGDGLVPAPLRAPGLGVDVRHRDARLAIGELRDGRILIAMTRFEGLGGVFEQLPLGPTVPEMAGLMGALGCSRAVLLDGGISSQLALRDAGTRTHAWPGMRRVPLALLGFSRLDGGP